MTHRPSRRAFLATATTSLATGYFVNPTAARESDSPNERLRIACVGATGRAAANNKAVASQQIVALSDVDANLLDKGAAGFTGVRKYRDFRTMLEKEADRIDAVVVGTPDHNHAPAAAMACAWAAKAGAPNPSLKKGAISADERRQSR